MPFRLRLSAVLCLLSTLLTSVEGGETEAGGAKFFENEVRPLLVQHCYECHASDKPKGELRLDSIGAILTGGESGPAIVEGEPGDSLLMEAVRWESFEMPPGGKLSPDEIAVLQKWIKLGAPWPGGDRKVRPQDQKEKITNEDRKWWAFQPIAATAPPRVGDPGWSQGLIDPFVYHQQKQAGLSPAGLADRETLIRRASFDVRGIPPTPEEVAAFVADDSADAYENLIDSFLESPYYGERQAVLWLDLVRYADSDGYKADAFRPHAWRYRDYVIRSFNADKSYRRFVREQLAGDELAAAGDYSSTTEKLDCLIATGYLRNGIYEYNQRDVRTQWDHMLIDIVDTTSDVFLATGAGCARCHDHKFDPILQKDYYRLKAFFTPMVHIEQPVANASEQEIAAQEKRLKQWEAETAEIRNQLAEIESPHYERAERSAAVKFPPDVRDMLLKQASERTPYEKQIVQLANRQMVGDRAKVKFPDKLKGDEKESWVELQRRLKEHGQKPKVSAPTIRMATDVGPESPATTLAVGKNESEISPGFFTILSPGAAQVENATSKTTGRRLTLAKWITSDDNPLGARVIVNRIWQQHFGRGLVATASDFGRLGQPPSHPELLDSLTADFIAGGWKMKRLHRMILLSATYRQSSHHEEASRYQTIDPENRMLWRSRVRRLTAEQIRDSMLFVSHELDTARGGSPTDMTGRRLSVYSKILRNKRDPLLDAFDFPDRFSSAENRNTTTTPVQSLFMINGAWTLARATSLAKSLKRQYSDRSDQIASAWRRIFGREPTSAESAGALKFLSSQDDYHEATSPKAKTFGELAGGNAIVFPDDPTHRLLSETSPSLAKPVLLIDTTFELKSLYPDATVRTLVSQWNGDTKQDGWAIGVTSTKSAFKPRNFIVQVVSDGAYEVVASDLRPELNKPYRAMVLLEFGGDGNSQATFLLQEIGADKPVQSSVVSMKARATPLSKNKLAIGSRDKSSRHFWHGSVGATALFQAEKPSENLESFETALKNQEAVARWMFQQESLKSSVEDFALKFQHVEDSNGTSDPLVDLMHVLMNTNEFLYVD